MAEEKTHVLIVADDSRGGELATHLTEERFRVAFACGLDAGLDAARSRAFDVLLLFRREQNSVENEIVDAARARNGDVEVIRAQPDGQAQGEPVLRAVLEGLPTRGGVRGAAGRFHQLLEELFDGVLMVNVRSETIALANPAAARVLGYSQEEMGKMNVWSLFPEDCTRDVKAMFERIVKTGRVADDTLVLRRSNGGTFRCRCNALCAGRRSNPYIQIVFRDANDTEKPLDHHAERAQPVLTTEIISRIVHEINNPLAAVLGYSQLSLTTSSRKRLDEYLQTIHQQAARCQAIVQKLSSFTEPPTR
jgi:PAS domain S-box-containing protein